MENLDFNVNALLQEVLGRRQTEGALSRDEFSDLVDELLDEKRTSGELDDDADVEQVRQTLLAQWSDIAEGDNAEALGVSEEE